MSRMTARAVSLPVLLAAVLAAPLAGSTARAQDATPAACAVASPDANERAALDWYAAINDRDLGRFDTLMTAETIYGAASAADGTGPAAVREIYQSALDGFTNLAYTPQQVVAEGDYVAVRYIADGDNTGEFRGVPPTGKHIAWTGIGVMRMECGRIAQTWMESDQMTRGLALGTAQDIPVVTWLTTPAQQANATAAPPAPICEESTAEHSRLAYFVWDEVWDTGNIPLIDGLLTDRAAGAGMYATTPGESMIEGLTESVSTFRTAMPDLRSDVEFAFANEEFVVAVWVDRGTMTGEFKGIAPSGEPVAYSGISILRLECGRIAENWYQFNAADLLDQMKAAWRR